LVDQRKLKLSLRTSQLFDVAEFTAGYSDLGYKIALVYNIEDYEYFRFWETVGLNRGLSVKIYTDISEAEAWLT